MTNTVIFAAMTEDVVFSGKGLTVSVDERVMRTWKDSRQIRPDAAESFGILIGSCKNTGNFCRVERITTPGQCDVQSRFHFLLHDPEHQEAANRAFSQSAGFLGYLGTWHTHPEAHPTPSKLDLNDWLVCIKRNPDRLLYFVIVGTEEVRVFVRQGEKFEMLQSEWSNQS